MLSLHELEKLDVDYYVAGSQLKDHIYRRARERFAAGDAARDALRTTDDVARRQREVRKFFGDCVGGLPASDSPLNARVTGALNGEGFRIDKVIFESRPRHYVTCNLYLPDGVTKPTAAVLFLCGHYNTGKHWREFQTVCQILAQSGLIVLAQDPIGQGERHSYWEASQSRHTVEPLCTEHDYAGAQCHLIGDSSARYFAHDAMRSIDYLISRPEVDAKRIGVTGNSGGGLQTGMIMMLDPRIAAAAPGTFIMSRESYMLCGQCQDSEQVWPGFTGAGFDHEDILIGAWPKPVMVLATTYDFFPIEGARRTVQRCKRLWEIAGKADDLRLVEDVFTHEYTPALATAAARFFNEKLNGRAVDPKPHRVNLFTDEQLRCTTSGQVRGELPEAQFIFEANRDRLAQLERSRPSPADARRWLRDRVNANRPRCETNLRVTWKRHCRDLDVENGLWWSQPELLGHGVMIRHENFRGQKLPVTIAVWADGTHAVASREPWIRATCAAGRAVLVLNTSGEGPLRPDRMGPAVPRAFYDALHYLADHLAWLGDDLASHRTYDVTRAIDVLREWPGASTDEAQLFGDGPHGLYAHLAAAVDERVKKFERRGAIESFASIARDRFYDAYDIKGLVVHGLLRRGDLDDLSR